MKRIMSLAALIAAFVATPVLAGKPVRPPTVEGLGVFADGELIGRLLDNTDGRHVTLISITGYLFRLDEQTGLMFQGNSIFFTGTNCTGEAAVLAYGNLTAQGVVMKFFDTLLYLRKGSAIEQPRDFASEYSSEGGGCFNNAHNGLPQTAVLLPNDPAVTGVSTVQFTLPIVFGTP